jgi:hypothetical protein
MFPALKSFQGLFTKVQQGPGCLSQTFINIFSKLIHEKEELLMAYGTGKHL